MVEEIADGVLVARAAEGDVAAFEGLVRRYQLQVFRMCVNMLGDEHAARDASQDVFFVLWRGLVKFRGEAKFSTYLYRVATNRCLKELSRRRPEPTVDADRQPTRLGLPEPEVEAAETMEAVRVAVAALTAEQRAPLLLREVEGLGYVEIATVLGVSVAAVKSRLNRARAEVAQGLEACR